MEEKMKNEKTRKEKIVQNLKMNTSDDELIINRTGKHRCIS
jgi:hypothetical protein